MVPAAAASSADACAGTSWWRPPMTVLELKEFESLENLQALFRDPEAQERLSHLGVRTALVATWDGLVVDSVVNDDQPVALETLAANAAAALQLSHDKPARGHVDGVLAEFDAGSTLIVDPVGDNSLVAFVINPSSDVEHLRAELRTLVKLHATGGSAPPAHGGHASPAKAPAKAARPALTPSQTTAHPPPDGYGCVLDPIAPLASAAGRGARAVSVRVLFRSPGGEPTLLGIAKLTGDDPGAGAKMVLSAVNSHLEAVLALQNDYIN